MNLTYGAELEVPDWNCLIGTPLIEELGAKRNLVEQDICNSSGVSVDPKLRTCVFGGEINTKPTDSIESQVQHIMDIYKKIFYKLNYSVGMHIHIRVPGLKEDLNQLKRWSKWLMENQDDYRRRVIESVVESDMESNYFFETQEDLKLFRKRYTYRKQNRYRKLKEETFERQMQAETPEEWYQSFFSRNSKGKIIWMTGYRPFINLTQLFNGEVDTIEFRGFNMTDDPDELLECFKICQAVVDCVYNDTPFEKVSFDQNKLPKCLPFDPKLEKTYLYLRKCEPHNPGGVKVKYRKNERDLRLKELLDAGTISLEDLGVPLSNLDLKVD